MERENEQAKLVDLGTASEQTLGAKGDLSDFVREIPGTTGISDD
jgi:hypothetical protein